MVRHASLGVERRVCSGAQVLNQPLCALEHLSLGKRHDRIKLAHPDHREKGCRTQAGAGYVAAAQASVRALQKVAGRRDFNRLAYALDFLSLGSVGRVEQSTMVAAHLRLRSDARSFICSPLCIVNT